MGMATLGVAGLGKVGEEAASPFLPDTLTHPGWAVSDSSALSPSFICNQEAGRWGARGIFRGAPSPPRNLGGGGGRGQEEGEWKGGGTRSGSRTFT